MAATHIRSKFMSDFNRHCAKNAGAASICRRLAAASLAVFVLGGVVSPVSAKTGWDARVAFNACAEELDHSGFLSINTRYVQEVYDVPGRTALKVVPNATTDQSQADAINICAAEKLGIPTTVSEVKRRKKSKARPGIVSARQCPKKNAPIMYRGSLYCFKDR